MNPSSRFCTQCGAPLAAEARFCGQCGAPVRQASPAAATPPVQAYTPAPPPPVVPRPPLPAQPPAYVAPAPQQGEPTLSITPGLTRSKGFLGMGRDTFTLLTTPTRLVFAYLDPKAMNQLVAEARADAKAQGKGFLGQWGAQMGWLNGLVRRYQTMSVDAILAQTPGSFYIPNATVTRVRVRQVSTNSESNIRDQTRIVIDTTGGKHKFDLAQTVGVSHREVKQRLQQALGAIVK